MRLSSSADIELKATANFANSSLPCTGTEPANLPSPTSLARRS